MKKGGLSLIIKCPFFSCYLNDLVRCFLSITKCYCKRQHIFSNNILQIMFLETIPNLNSKRQKKITKSQNHKITESQNFVFVFFTFSVLWDLRFHFFLTNIFTKFKIGFFFAIYLFGGKKKHILHILWVRCVWHRFLDFSTQKFVGSENVQNDHFRCENSNSSNSLNTLSSNSAIPKFSQTQRSLRKSVLRKCGGRNTSKSDAH